MPELSTTISAAPRRSSLFREALDVDTPTLGRVLRRARERRQLGLRQVATTAGVSPSFLTRLERDAANPTWRTIESIAAALGAQPLLRLIADEAAVADASAMIERLSPLQRLLHQPVKTVITLEWFAHYKIPFVIEGSVAAMLQGMPTPVDGLRLLVKNDDEAVEKLGELLYTRNLVFVELEPDELRGIVERSWPFDECDVTIKLVDELPPSAGIPLDDFEVRVVLPQALLNDPEVAATLRISAMGSSEL